MMCLLPFLVPEKKEEIKIEQSESRVEEEREDLQSRWEYEQQMLADPKTGRVPSNYRQKELEFVESLKNPERTEARSESKEVDATQDGLIWNAVGPNNFGGRTRAFALDITDENVLLAGGVSGGMWKSTNGGESWRKTTSLNQIHSVSSIVQDTRSGREDTWYYGTGELVGNSTRAPGAPFRGNGIFRSNNGGESWQQIPSTAADTEAEFTSPLQYVWDIELDPSQSNDVILAAIWGGIVRSDDGGATWTTVLGDDLLNLPPGTDLNEVRGVIFYTDIHRAADNTFYASLSSVTNNDSFSPWTGVYRSTDGINWTRIVTLTSGANRRTEITSSPSNPDIAYFLTDSSLGYRLRRYDNSIDEVIDLSRFLPENRDDLEAFDSQSSYNLLVKVHPTNPDIVFVGGTNLYRNTNGFLTSDATDWIGGYNPDQDNGAIYPNHHPDQHELVFLPSDPNKAYSVNDGGIFLTEDITASEVTYRPKNNGYITTQFYTGTISKYDQEDFLFGGTQDNGTLLTFNFAQQNTSNGVRVIGGDGGFTASTRFGVYYYVSFQNSRIYRVRLNQNAQITSFARVDPSGGASDPDQPYLFINPYVLDPNNGNRMYLAGGDFVWRNRNLSQIASGSNARTSTNWTRLQRSEISEGIISALEVSSTPADILYYGTSIGQLFRVNSASTEEYVVEEITGANFPEQGYIRSLSIDPRNADQVLVSFSNYGIPSLFYSSDGGQTFEDVSGNLEENLDGSGGGPSVRWVTTVPKIGGGTAYFVGTSVGLFSTTQLSGSNTVWSQDDHTEIGNVVVNMVDYRRDDGKIVSSTHGNGMYSAQLFDVLPYQDDPSDNEFEFQGVYPNPIQDFATVKFSVPDTDFVVLRVYNSSGRMVYLSSGTLAFTGVNEVYWAGSNTLNQPVPNGVYILRLTYRGNSFTKKVLLNR